MIWWIFSLCAFIASFLVAVLYAFDDWFCEHDRLEDVLICTALLLVSPFIVLGVLWYEVLSRIRD
jgi:hypothetical protein